jgi:hypothetical protein
LTQRFWWQAQRYQSLGVIMMQSILDRRTESQFPLGLQTSGVSWKGWMGLIGTVMAIPVVAFVLCSGQPPTSESAVDVLPYARTLQSAPVDMDATVGRIVASRTLRGDVVRATEQAILADLSALAQSVDGAQFAETALSWESTSKWMQGREIHRAWLEERFGQLVTSPDDARDIIEVRLKAMQTALLEINEAMFVAEGMDSSQMHRPCPLIVDMSAAWYHCNQAIDKAQEAGDFAPVEAVGSFVVSSLIGMAAESAVRNLGPTDASGNPSRTSQGAATAAGFGAGLASDMVTTELIGSEKNLTQAVNAIVGQALTGLQPGGRWSSIWELPMYECALYERSETEDAMVRKHGRPLSDALKSLK